MLRLLIADDEKFIRESIRNLIHWEDLGIEVVSVCTNGIEAYQSVIDDYPDIVLTDLKMPGLSGLELISRVRNADADIDFVILSGYGEFQYAQEAMKYGVRHYLLKPCSEDEIVSVMKEIILERQKKAQSVPAAAASESLPLRARQALLRNILLESLASHELVAPPSLVKEICPKATPWSICYFYYLEEHLLRDFLLCFYRIMEPRGFSQDYFTVIYVKNTLILFFEANADLQKALEELSCSLKIDLLFSQIEMRLDHEASLLHVFRNLLPKIMRYESIYLMDGTEKLASRNLSRLLSTTQKCLQSFANPEEPTLAEWAELTNQLRLTDSPETLKTLLADLLLNQASSVILTQSPVLLAEFLLEIRELQDIDAILALFEKEYPRFFQASETVPSHQKDFIGRTLQYIQEHLSDSNLSLKSISQNYLYMNVDYVSKQFVKQTGIKFSAYLTNLRIEKAKEMLLQSSSESIYMVAEEIGFGNNPQYFSQIFKKATGMTPTVYQRTMKGTGEKGE